MSITVTGPSGETIDFPDGTDHATIDGVMRQHFGGGQPQPQQAQQPQPQQAQIPQNNAGISPEMNGLASGMRATTRGLTAGLSDYVDAGARYAADKFRDKPMYASYNDALKGERADVDQFKKTNPIAAYSSEIGGGMMNPLFSGAPAQAAASTGARYLQYAKEGGRLGAMFGAGNARGQGGGLPSIGDVAKSTSAGGAGGALIGAAVPAVAEGGAKAFKGIVGAFQDNIGTAGQTAADFKTAAQAAYKASEDAGVVISPDAMQKFAQDLPGQLKGYHPVVNEKAGKLIQMLQTEADQPMTLSYLDGLRSVASGESISRDPNDARLAGSVVNKIDDFIDNLKPADLVAGGDEKAATESLSAARDLWKTHAKLRDVEQIVTTGENLADPNWVKNQFRAIVRNPTKFNRYSEDEQQAISDIAKTGLLEKVTKLIPWRGIQMASTYAAPLAQQQKIGTLQDIIARGVRPQASIFGSSPKGLPFAARAGVPALSPFMTGGSNQ